MNFKPNLRREQVYYRDLLQILSRWFQEEQSGQPVRLLRPAEWIEKYAWQAAQRMVTGLYADGFKTWRRAAEESMQGPKLYAALQLELHGSVGRRVRALVAENATLIKTLPEKVALTASREAARLQQAGERPEFMLPSNVFKDVARWQARRLARTEMGKASTALTRARSENLDLPWYVWQTSQDQRVRPSHRMLQSVIVRFDDPPAPELLDGIRSSLGHYNAGDAPNCRCYPEPLLRFDQVAWPHRIYRSGRVQRLTLAQFRQINSTERFVQEAA